MACVKDASLPKKPAPTPSHAEDRNAVELSLTLKQGSPFDSMLEGGDVISHFVKNGILKGFEPSLRRDYSSFYIPTKNVQVLGGRLIIYEHEYMEQFIGCCVNEGNAAVLLIDSDIAHIEAFANANKCMLEKGDEISLPDNVWELLNLNSEIKSRLIEVSCKANYRFDSKRTKVQ